MIQRNNTFYTLIFKRLLDIVGSFTIILLFGWLYLIVAFLVRVRLGSPVLFKQKRPGIIDKKTGKEKIFKLYKFRTMTNEKDEKGNLLPDKDRLTGFGIWLRQTSLDEIPEVFNILKGDMSFVGPRPLLVQYLDRYNDKQHHRHDVKPGLTGYAQVHGRNSISWEDKFAMDIWYIKNVSFLLDAKIIISTIQTVLKRDGISSETSATMEEFMGTSEENQPRRRDPS